VEVISFFRKRGEIDRRASIKQKTFLILLTNYLQQFDLNKRLWGMNPMRYPFSMLLLYSSPFDRLLPLFLKKEITSTER
jgi:hypothetical protein